MWSVRHTLPSGLVASYDFICEASARFEYSHYEGDEVDEGELVELYCDDELICSIGCH